MRLHLLKRTKHGVVKTKSDNEGLNGNVPEIASGNLVHDGVHW